MSKIRLRFSKIGDVKFISHLDTMRLFDRVFRRAAIKLSCTNGFNKHSKMSFACPTPVGLSSLDEYIDIEVEDNTLSDDFDKLINKINEKMVDGIKIEKAKLIDDSEKSIMSMISAARYKIILIGIKDLKLIQNLDDALNMPSLSAVKKTKKGEASVNVKELIYEVNYSVLNKDTNKCDIEITLLCAAGSASNLNVDLFLNALNNAMNLYSLIDDYSYERVNLYMGEFPNLKRPIED